MLVTELAELPNQLASHRAFDPGAARPALERWLAELDAETARVESSSFVPIVRAIGDRLAPDMISPHQTSLWVNGKPSVGIVGRADATEYDLNFGQGTGYLVDKNLVATAYHVVAPVEDAATELGVHFSGQRYPAELAAWNEGRDVAVLRLTSRKLPDAPSLRLSLETLPQGSPVVGIGYPHGRYSASPGRVQYIDFSTPTTATAADGRMVIVGNRFGNIPEYVFRAPGRHGLSGSPFLDELDQVVGTTCRVPDLDGQFAYTVLTHSIDTINLLLELR